SLLQSSFALHPSARLRVLPRVGAGRAGLPSEILSQAHRPSSAIQQSCRASASRTCRRCRGCQSRARSTPPASAGARLGRGAAPSQTPPPPLVSSLRFLPSVAPLPPSPGRPQLSCARLRLGERFGLPPPCAGLPLTTDAARPARPRLWRARP